MTKKKLFRIVLAVVLLLIGYIGLGTYTRILGDKWFDLYKTLLPVGLAVPAAILASAFQRRVSYLQALRDLWKQLIPAVQKAIQYTHLRDATQSEFSDVMVELSTATDSLRGVFANVPAKDAPTGRYPYENLKDIQKIIEWVGYGDTFRSRDRTQARRCLVRLWQEMHSAMLREFDRDVPLNPVSKYFYNGKSIADHLLDGTLTEESLKRNNLPSRGCPK